MCQVLGRRDGQVLGACAPGGTDPNCEVSEKRRCHAFGSNEEEQTCFSRSLCGENGLVNEGGL